MVAAHLARNQRTTDRLVDPRADSMGMACAGAVRGDAGKRMGSRGPACELLWLRPPLLVGDSAGSPTCHGLRRGRALYVYHRPAQQFARRAPNFCTARLVSCL